MTERTVRFGVVGVKGFSQRHITWINRAAAGGARVEVGAAATIFSDPGARAAGDALARGGVEVVESFDQLLSLRDKVDIITLPVGIHLHAPLAIKALQAGFPVYMEKPAAGTVDEIAAMAAAEKATGNRVFVGFQTMYQPSTWALKRRLLAGLVGKLRRIVITLAWPRAMSYYRRNNWAGKIKVDDTFIYDCPMNNSAGHFPNIALFLAGAREDASAAPIGVEAELYHASPVESADSTFCRFATREGVDIVFNGTQACAANRDATLDIVGERGSVRIADHEERILAPWTVVDATGNARVDGTDIPRAEVFARVAAAFLDPGMIEVCTLATAGMHTAANQMAFAATEVGAFPPEFVERLPRDNGDELFVVKGMNESMELLRPEGLLPHESGKCPWAAKPGVLGAESAAELLAVL